MRCLVCSIFIEHRDFHCDICHNDVRVVDGIRYTMSKLLICWSPLKRISWYVHSLSNDLENVSLWARFFYAGVVLEYKFVTSVNRSERTQRRESTSMALPRNMCQIWMLSPASLFVYDPSHLGITFFRSVLTLSLKFEVGSGLK
jgi:hypothetical protein